MALKVTLFFNQFTNGWTETYYTIGTDPYAYINQLNIPILANQALYFRAAGTYLYAIRASLIGGQRLNYSQVFGQQYASPATLLGDADYPSIDVLVKISTPIAIKRYFWFRGLEEVDTTIVDGVQTISAAIRQALFRYINFLTNNCSAMIQYYQRPPAGGLFWTPVAQITPAGGPTQPFSFVQVAAGFGFTASYLQRIAFVGKPVDLLPGFPVRTYVANFVAGPPPVITVPYLYRGPGPIEYPTKMKVVVQVPQYQSFGTPVIERITSHKTGRAFGVSRGRLPFTIRAQ
jgi:hypothetical protein